MSRKNSLLQKSIRRDERRSRQSTYATRTQLSDLPLEARTEVLVNPKEKMTRAVRRSVMASGFFSVDLPREAGIRFEVKNTLRLSKFPLVRVIRELKRTARRISTLEHLAQKATLGSKHRERLENAAQIQRGYLGQVKAEYAVRLDPTLKTANNESH